MSWIKPEYSRQEVNWAGSLVSGKAYSLANDDEQSRAHAILGNWRSSHSYPINTFQASLRKKLRSIEKNALVAQRLKRTPSIIGKLQRFPKMQLARMQDIGGLRAVVKNVTNVYELRNKLVKSRFDHELVNEKDYIQNPKNSGYRGIHLIYKYKSRKAPSYDGLLIEIQLRTKLQHAWATAVETMGTFLQQSLKTSQGAAEWLDFFSLAGSAFAHLENKPSAPCHFDINKADLFGLVTDLAKALKVSDNLRAYRISANAIENEQVKKAYYYLLTLKPKARVVNIKGYQKNQLQEATERYLQLEREVDGEEISQVVLVAADSLKQLYRAYPNYFLDTEQFTSVLDRINKEQ
jgi:putative GTP pyrophosphokinase